MSRSINELALFDGHSRLFSRRDSLHAGLICPFSPLTSAMVLEKEIRDTERPDTTAKEILQRVLQSRKKHQTICESNMRMEDPFDKTFEADS